MCFLSTYSFPALKEHSKASQVKGGAVTPEEYSFYSEEQN